MPLFQITLNQGRTDTLYNWFTSLDNAKLFYETLSTAMITSIREVVYSKKYGINYTPLPKKITPPYYKELSVIVGTEHYHDRHLTFRFAPKTLTLNDLVKNKHLFIVDGQRATRIVDAIIKDKD
jgi:hypothetical protein